MKDKPVAYGMLTFCKNCGEQNPYSAKTLTDEEIKFIAHPFESVYTTYDKQTDTDTVHARFDQLGFARAILRKAQEK
jgi:biotin synthase-like enzyme